MKSSYTSYSKTLPMARDIYEAIYGKPTSHDDWAKSFNIVGGINKILIKNNVKVPTEKKNPKFKAGDKIFVLRGQYKGLKGVFKSYQKGIYVDYILSKSIIKVSHLDGDIEIVNDIKTSYLEKLNND